MNTAIVPHDGLDPMTVAKALAASGYFADARDANQALVKVLAGREMGLGPVAAMTGVYVVKGRPALSANLLAGVLKRGGRYNFRVTKHDDTICEITFFERTDAGTWDEIGRSVFTAADARRAGTQNMDRFPRNMLYARAMTNGIRWYCPDVCAGGLYTPEELGAPVNEDGDVVDVKAVSVQPVEAEPLAPKARTNGHGMAARYAALAAEAADLGLKAEPVESFASETELVSAGKALKAAVAAARAQAQDAVPTAV